MNPSIDLTKLSPEAAARAVSRLAWVQRCLFVLVALLHGLAVAWLLSVFHGFLLAVVLASVCVLMVMVWSYASTCSLLYPRLLPRFSPMGTANAEYSRGEASHHSARRGSTK